MLTTFLCLCISFHSNAQESIKQNQQLDLDYYFNLGVTINFPDGSEYLDQTVLKTFYKKV